MSTKSKTDTPAQAIEKACQYARAIQLGVDDAKAFLKKSRHQEIDINLIFSAYRSNPDLDFARQKPLEARQDRINAAHSVLQAAIAGRQKGLRVHGFDICGDERNFALHDFEPVIRTLQQYNIKAWKDFCQGKTSQDLRIGFTPHVAETDVTGVISHPQEVLTAPQAFKRAIELFYDLTPEESRALFQGKLASKEVLNLLIKIAPKRLTPFRIGHGVRIVDDPALLPQLLRVSSLLGIGLEQCPKSNYHTAAIPYWRAHPSLELSRKDFNLPDGLMRYFNLGKRPLISIGMDNSTVSKTTPTNERVKLKRYENATHQDRRRFEFNGAETAFLFNQAQKSAIVSDMRTQYRKLAQKDQQIIQHEREGLYREELLQERERKAGILTK